MESKGGYRMVNTADDTLKWCSVSVREVINKGYRLEASVFDVDDKKAWEEVINSKYGSVSLMGNDGLIKNAYYPGRFKRIYTEYGGEPFYLPSQMNDIYPKVDKRISKLTNCDMEELRLKEKTLLLTRSGTIGNVGYVSKTLEGKVFSDDVIRVTFKNGYDLGYCYAFLKSKAGSKVLQTNGYGSVITHLEPDHLREMVIPDAPIKIRIRINDLIEKSYNLRDKSNKLLDRAEGILFEELHLPPEEALESYNKRDVFSVPLSRLNNRLDGSYHLPIVEYIKEMLKKHANTVVPLNDKSVTSSIILAPRFKRVYVEEGYGRIFIGGKEIYQLDPNNKKYLSNVHHKDLIKDKLEIHENMTLITCSGTIGKVAFVGKHWDGWAVNQHVLRVVPVNEDIAGYLYVFLQSKYGYYLITKYTYGSVIDEIDDNQIGEIPIPILKDKAKQKEINDLALEANRMRYDAYVCEQEALDIMNNEVLKNDGNEIQVSENDL